MRVSLVFASITVPESIELIVGSTGFCADDSTGKLKNRTDNIVRLNSLRTKPGLGIALVKAESPFRGLTFSKFCITLKIGDLN